MTYEEKQEAAFEKHQAENPYTYSDLERLIWLHGYSQAQLDRSKKELEEISK